MSLRSFGVLDRYVLKQWCITFVISAFGVPAVAVIIDLSERFARLSDAHVPVNQIFLGELFLFPSKMAILVPAAVLFATVFTLNALGRHSELTAVQGGGISFYRLIAPMLILATIAVPADFELQELASYSTTRQKELHHEKASARDQFRSSFAYASPSGWTWGIKEMHAQPPRAIGFVGEGAQTAAGQRWTVAADSAVWIPSKGWWSLRRGNAYLVSDSLDVLATFQFRSMRLRPFSESPAALMTQDKKAEEMTTAELRDYLKRLKLSGADPGALGVELPLKYAVPVACLIVALFGAPLAITNARAGAAIGLAIALGTTLAYLTGLQIMKAVGGKGIIDYHVAAWSMNVVFLLIAVVLLARVKS
ncbi:MAG TPA: LptF/LptG family permease [Gemmatimonadales bacterium]|jgi:lipopolysaccharide export system permease protein